MCIPYFLESTREFSEVEKFARTSRPNMRKRLGESIRLARLRDATEKLPNRKVAPSFLPLVFV
jgi:hypothetical protein